MVDASQTTDDLMRDGAELLTWMCTNLYGRRGPRNHAMRAVTAAKHDPSEVTR